MGKCSELGGSSERAPALADNEISRGAANRLSVLVLGSRGH